MQIFNSTFQACSNIVPEIPENQRALFGGVMIMGTLVVGLVWHIADRYFDHADAQLLVTQTVHTDTLESAERPILTAPDAA